MVPTDWYTAARTIDQNRATNEAFRSSYQTPSVAPTLSHPSTFNTVQFQAPERSTNDQHAPTPGNPVPMDINASRKTQPLHSLATDVEKQDTKLLTVLSDLTSES